MTSSPSPRDIEQLVEFSRKALSDTLPFDKKIDEEDLYSSLPFCVVDAVFSISAKYESTEAVGKRLATHQGWHRLRSEGGAEVPLSELLRLYREFGVERMADEVYQNRQRTSTKNGILKSEAVLLFAEALVECGVQTLADFAVADRERIEVLVTQIPGQRSGISLRYFYMVTGDYNYVKPDRFVMLFTKTALNGRDLTVSVCHEAIVQTCLVLQAEYPHLKPRTLDSRIWWWGREQKGI